MSKGNVIDIRSKTVETPKYPPARYAVQARSASEAEIFLDGVIGDMYDGITAKQFTKDLQAFAGAKTLNIHINSPGGFVMEGRAIYNRLKAHSARKIVTVDSEASSIAALIAMAGDEIHMADGALMLVHKAWMLTIGNEDDHMKAIENMRTVDQTLIATFMARSGQSAESITALMKEDRYMSGQEAVERGFADSVDGASQMAALAVDREALRLPPIPTTNDAKKLREQRARAAVAEGAALIRR